MANRTRQIKYVVFKKLRTVCQKSFLRNFFFLRMNDGTTNRLAETTLRTPGTEAISEPEYIQRLLKYRGDKIQRRNGNSKNGLVSDGEISRSQESDDICSQEYHTDESDLMECDRATGTASEDEEDRPKRCRRSILSSLLKGNDGLIRIRSKYPDFPDHKANKRARDLYEKRGSIEMDRLAAYFHERTPQINKWGDLQLLLSIGSSAFLVFNRRKVVNPAALLKNPRFSALLQGAIYVDDALLMEKYTFVEHAIRDDLAITMGGRFNTRVERAPDTFLLYTRKTSKSSPKSDSSERNSSNTGELAGKPRGCGEPISGIYDCLLEAEKQSVSNVEANGLAMDKQGTTSTTESSVHGTNIRGPN